MPLKIFSDFHHSGLYKSLHLLFENRLGHELYRPIGTEFYENGYWKIAEPYQNNPATIAQYLGYNTLPIDHSTPLNDVDLEDKGIFYIRADGYQQKAITLHSFKHMPIDVVIASYQPHVECYMDLIKKYHPEAKLITQLGNEWTIDPNMSKNVLASIEPKLIPQCILNNCFYHQEFEWPGKFEPTQNKQLSSFVNTLDTAGYLRDDWAYFQTLERSLKEYSFKCHGGGCRDGALGSKDMFETIKNTRYGIHLKNGGDGYGHVAHTWFACGRPVIFRGSQYKEKLAGKLMDHGVTGWDVERISPNALVEIIRHQDEKDYNLMCEMAYQRFIQVVDFDKEAQQVQEFMERLV